MDWCLSAYRYDLDVAPDRPLDCHGKRGLGKRLGVGHDGRPVKKGTPDFGGRGPVRETHCEAPAEVHMPYRGKSTGCQSNGRDSRRDRLRELALANFELLLEHWGIDYERVNENEYDFRNPTRLDHNFGACRFNLRKGYGADFALRDIATNGQFQSIGRGFTKRDFCGFTGEQTINHGFDIIGLCQRVYKYSRYQDGAKRLQSDIEEISKTSYVKRPSDDAANQRKIQAGIDNQKRVHYAKRIWRSCQNIKFTNTAGEKYLLRRSIYIDEPSMRFHPQILDTKNKVLYPAIIFKVSKVPDGDLEAIHRIYLTPQGQKADIDDPKRALARVQGCGIWFGSPCESLVVAEGPEEALSCRQAGAEFVVSTLNATNYHSLTIPEYVKIVVLVPDKDEAGKLAAHKAKEAYSKNAIIKWGTIPQ